MRGFDFAAPAGWISRALMLIAEVAAREPPVGWDADCAADVNAWVHGWGRGPRLLERLASRVGEAGLADLLLTSLAAAHGQWSKERRQAWFDAAGVDAEAVGVLELNTLRPVLWQMGRLVVGGWRRSSHEGAPRGNATSAERDAFRKALLDAWLPEAERAVADLRP